MTPEARQKITELDEARHRSEVATAEYKRVRAEVRDWLAEQGIHTGVTVDEARDLYWNNPDLSGKVIATTLGLAPNKPAELVEALGGKYDVYCARCRGVAFTSRMTRTNPKRVDNRDGSLGGLLCADCRKASNVERERDAAERAALRAAEEVARTERIAAGGYWLDSGGTIVLSPGQKPAVDWQNGGYSHFNGLGGCYGAFLLINAEFARDAWRHGGDIVFECEDCGGQAKTTLTTWVPPREPRPALRLVD